MEGAEQPESSPSPVSPPLGSHTTPAHTGEELREFANRPIDRRHLLSNSRLEEVQVGISKGTAFTLDGHIDDPSRECDLNRPLDLVSPASENSDSTCGTEMVTGMLSGLWNHSMCDDKHVLVTGVLHTTQFSPSPATKPLSQSVMNIGGQVCEPPVTLVRYRDDTSDTLSSRRDGKPFSSLSP